MVEWGDTRKEHGTEVPRCGLRACWVVFCCFTPELNSFLCKTKMFREYRVKEEEMFVQCYPNWNIMEENVMWWVKVGIARIWFFSEECEPRFTHGTECQHKADENAASSVQAWWTRRLGPLAAVKAQGNGHLDIIPFEGRQFCQELRNWLMVAFNEHNQWEDGNSGLSLILNLKTLSRIHLGTRKD